MTHPPANDPALPPALLEAVFTGPGPSEASDVVVFVHGITANSHSWPLVTGRLPEDLATISVDLRGRGDSAGLPGPWGMGTHADDLAQLLDSLGITAPVLMVGHSMGAFVVSTFAVRYPNRIRGAVLVDGGVELVDPSGPAGGMIDLDELLDMALGPAMERLSVSYESRAEYRLFWQAHPAFADSPWTEDLERYINHDLGGMEPVLMSRVVPEAVRQDGSEVFSDPDVAGAIERMSCPVELLRAERGMFNQPEPLIAQAVAERASAANPQLRLTAVPGVNHYTIVMSPAGGDAVAAAVRRQL